MEHIDHFGSEELISFKIAGEEFKYKQLIAEDELGMDFDYCHVDGKFDNKRYKLLRLAHNLKEIPYDKTLIGEIIGTEIEWKDLDIDNRLKLLSKIKSIILANILEETDRIDLFQEELKKKLPVR